MQQCHISPSHTLILALLYDLPSAANIFHLYHVDIFLQFVSTLQKVCIRMHVTIFFHKGVVKYQFYSISVCIFKFSTMNGCGKITKILHMRGFRTNIGNEQIQERSIQHVWKPSASVLVYDCFAHGRPLHGKIQLSPDHWSSLTRKLLQVLPKGSIQWPPARKAGSYMQERVSLKMKGEAKALQRTFMYFIIHIV